MEDDMTLFVSYLRRGHWAGQVIFLLGIAWVFTFADPACAATVSQTPIFSASGDAWSGGTVSNRSFGRNFSINLSDSQSIGPGVGCETILGITTCWGAEATLSTSGSIGVSLNASFTDPNYSVVNPYAVTINVPENTTLAGDGFSLGLTAVASDTALTTSFLTPSVNTNFFMTNLGASVSGEFCFAGCVGGSKTLLGPFTNTTTLVGFSNPGSGTTPSLTVLGSSTPLAFPYNLKVADTVTVTINNANISKTSIGNGSVTASTLQDVVKVKPDINKMLARATGIPLNLEVSFLGETLGYKTLWGEITPSVGVDMDSTFTAGAISTVLNLNKMIGHWNDPGHTGYTLVNSLSLSNGTSLSDYFFLHPGETVTVTPTYSVANGSFTHTTAATLHAPYSVKLLEGNLSGLGSFGPVYSTSGDLTLASISIASSNFAIPFTAMTGSTFQLTADPGTCKPAGTYAAGFIFDPLCSGTLIKNTTGTLELFADNSYGGGTNLLGGTLKVEKDTNLGASNGTLTFDGGVLLTRNFEGTASGIISSRPMVVNAGGGTFDTNGLNSTLSGAISGTGAFAKRGAGTLTLAGENTYSGVTGIIGGTLALSGSGSLSDQTGLNVSSGAAFNISAANGDREVGSLAGAGGILLGGRTLTTGGNNLNTTFSGTVSGSGGLTKVGSGTQILAGINSYTGPTRFNDGIMSVSADANLGSGGALLFDGGTLQSTGTFSTTRATTINSGGGTFDTAGSGVALTMNMNIDGAGMLTKTGTGRLVLPGSNNYQGGTTINGGTLALVGSGALHATGAVTVNAGTFDLAAKAFGATIGSLAGAGNVALGSTSLTTGGNDADTLFGGVISGAGSLFKAGGGTMILSGANTYSGATTVNGGMLQSGADEVLSDNGHLEVDGGIFNLSGYSETVGSVALIDGTLHDSSTGAGGLLAAATYDLQKGSVNAALGGGVLSKSTGATVLLNAATQASEVTISGGVLQLGKDEVVYDMASVNVGDSGRLDLNEHAETVGSLAGNGGVDLGAGELTTGGNGDDTLFSGVISGTGTMTKTGTGTMILMGINTYTGATTVDGGILQSGASEVLQDRGQLLLAGGGAFNLHGFRETIGSLAGDGTVSLGAGSLITGGNDIDTLFGGVISGAGTLTKTGAGTMVLSSDNLFTGLTTIETGTLTVNGSLVGDVQNNVLGKLMGSGSIDGMVSNDGVIAPGNSIGTLSVGNYLSNTGSTYEVEVNAAGNSDLIAATGTATLNGGDIAVQAPGVATDYHRRTFYDIVHADGGVMGAYDSVTSSLATLSPLLRYDEPDLVKLILMRNDINFGTLAGARTKNQISVAGVLTTFSLTAFTGDLADVLDIFVDDLAADARSAALDEMGGQKIHTAMPMVAFSLIEGFQGSIGSRMSRLHQTNQGAMAKVDPVAGVKLAMAGDVTDIGPLGRQDKSRNLWIHAYGVGGDVDRDKNAVGYDYDVYGLAVGIDFPVLKGMNLGFTAGYGKANVQTDLNDSGDINGVLAGIYANYENAGFYLDGMVTYADNSYETDRTVNFGTLSRNAEAEYDGEEWAGAAEAGYVVALGCWNIQPFFGTRFIRLDEDGFTEKGADDLDLKVGDRTVYSWKFYPGVKMSHPIKTSGKSLFVPELNVKWVHELRDNNDAISATFVGAPAAGNFRVEGVAIDDNSLEVGVGFKVLDGGTFQVGVNFKTEINSERSAHQAEFGMKHMW